jgi:hypothetical protein
MRLFGAYIHAKPDGTPFYVGKGREERAKRLDASHHNKHHSRIVHKYGKENISIGFIPCSSEQNAFDLEIGIIKCLRRSGVVLANITSGGEGVSGPKSKEHIEKLAASLRGRVGTFKGRNHSEETRAKISRINKGRVSPRKGVKLTVTQVQAMRARVKQHWASEQNRQKQRQAASSQMKPIEVCGVVFESIHAYSLYVNRALSTVSRWVKKGWQHKIDAAYKEVTDASK